MRRRGLSVDPSRIGDSVMTVVSVPASIRVKHCHVLVRLRGGVPESVAEISSEIVPLASKSRLTPAFSFSSPVTISKRGSLTEASCRKPLARHRLEGVCGKLYSLWAGEEAGRVSTTPARHRSGRERRKLGTLLRRPPGHSADNMRLPALLKHAGSPLPPDGLTQLPLLSANQCLATGPCGEKTADS